MGNRACTNFIAKKMGTRRGSFLAKSYYPARRECKITSVIESNERGERSSSLSFPSGVVQTRQPLPPFLRPSPPRSLARSPNIRPLLLFPQSGRAGGRAHALHAAHTPPPARFGPCFPGAGGRDRGGGLAGHGENSGFHLRPSRPLGRLMGVRRLAGGVGREGTEDGWMQLNELLV